jgi:hypothetical protein
MCFGVRAGSRKGVCIEARAASSQAVGMVCPEPEAMQIQNSPVTRTAVRWVALRHLIATECLSRGSRREYPAGELTVNVLLLVLILLNLLVGEPDLGEQL